MKNQQTRMRSKSVRTARSEAAKAIAPTTGVKTPATKMRFQDVKTESLVGAAYNPKVRTNNRELSELLNSIKKNGILYPLMVDSKMNVIDGHRRLACAKIMKYKTVPTIVSDSNLTKDEFYETINSTVRKMAANEMIYIFVNGGKVPPKTEKRLQILQEIMGTADLKRLGNKYISTSILSTGTKIGTYCGDKSPEFIRKAILWTVDQKQSYQVRKAIEDGVTKVSLIKAINSNKPLKRNWNI